MQISHIKMLPQIKALSRPRGKKVELHWSFIEYQLVSFFKHSAESEDCGKSIINGGALKPV